MDNRENRININWYPGHMTKAKRQMQEDIRLIDRAKCILIEYLNMTEKQAHKYIEKQAMDLRTTRRAVAESLLRTYES